MPPRPPFRIEYRRPDTLSPDELDALWAVFQTVADTTREVLLEGLRAMDEVFVVSQGGAVAGFGGVRVFHREWRGRGHCLIATGRVCLAPELRGRNVIHQVGLRYYLRERRAHPRWPVYWLFAASSYRSYLVMARNFREYWPRPDAAMPERERALLASVADALDPPSGDPSRADHPYSDLVYRDGGAAVDPDALRDPNIAYYARINPDPLHGGFVLALAPLTASNWAAAFFRAASRVLRRVLSGGRVRRTVPEGRRHAMLPPSALSPDGRRPAP